MVGVDKFKTTIENQQFIVYNKKTIQTLIESEIDAFKKYDIDIIVSAFNPTCSISTRVLNIPLIVLLSGTSSSAYFKSGYATFPENFENVFTRLLPESLKKYFTRWLLLNYKKFLVKDFNIVAKKYNVKKFKTLNDILEGDYTLLCDDINFLDIKPTNKFPIENFIGPISVGFSDGKIEDLDTDVKKHLEKPEKSILVMLGTTSANITSPIGKLFIEILKTLNKTNYNVIAVYTEISNKDIPKLEKNILLKKYLKYPQIVNKMVDLAIIHGGRGTVYNSAYSGKPSVGLPFFVEQQYNIDCLVRKKVCIRISTKRFKQEELLKAINKIFKNYDDYLKNAKALSEKLSKEIDENKAVNRLIQIIDKEIR